MHSTIEEVKYFYWNKIKIVLLNVVKGDVSERLLLDFSSALFCICVFHD
jgi:hypothetical protein